MVGDLPKPRAHLPELVVGYHKWLVYQDWWGRPIEGTLSKHVDLYRRLQCKWQCFDAYARVCMALGANQPLRLVNESGKCTRDLAAGIRVGYEGNGGIMPPTFAPYSLSQLYLNLGKIMVNN